MKPRNRFFTSKHVLSLVIFAGSGLSALPAAATLYWDANGATAGSGTPAAATWDTGTNWSNDSSGGSPGVAWANGQAAVFSAGTETAGTWTITIGGTVQTNSITFNGATNSTVHTITGGTIDMGATALTFNATAAGATTGRSKTIASKITGSGGLVLALNGDVSATGGGSNTLFSLTGANDFTGGVSVTSGLLSATSNLGDAANLVTLNGGGLVGATTTTLSRNVSAGASGGILRTYGSVTLTMSGAVSGSGSLTRTDAGTVIFTGDLSSYSGTLNNNAGATVYGADLSPTGAVAVNAGTVWVGNSGTTGSLVNASSITVAAGASLYVRRSDTVNATAILPTAINFPGSTSNIEFNPTVATGVLNLDRDLGTGTLIGQLRVSGGTVNLVSGTDVMMTTISLGLQTATNRGTINVLPGSTITARTLNLGETSNQSGTLNQSGGLVTLASGGFFRIGHWTSGTNPGTAYNLTGGTLDATALSANTATNDKMVNVGWDGQGDMVVGGGVDPALMRAYGIQVDANGDSTFNDSLTVSSNGTIEIGAGGTASASANDKLIGNGGTLKGTATGTWGAFLQANPSTTTSLIADAVNVTFSNNLLGTGTLSLSTPNSGSFILGGGTGTTSVAPVLAGAGVNVSKTGTGTVTLSNANTYTGTTTVSAGTLALAGSVSSAVNVADGATLSGEGVLNGTLTLGSSTGGTLVIDPTTAGSLTVNGGVILTGTNSLVLSKLPALGANSITILTHTGSLVGAPGTNLVLSGMTNYRTPVMSDDGTTLSLAFATKNLVWTGTGGGTWDIGSSSNWSDGAASSFYWADRVTFDDTGSNTSVVLAGSLAPSLITVNTSTNAYTITASAGNVLTGLGSLYKTGTSALTMVGANTYTGGTTLSQGTINLRTAGTLGTGDVTLGDASTGANSIALYLDTNRVNFGTKVIVSNNGTGTTTLGSRVNVTGTGDNNQFTSIVLQKDVIFDSNAADRTDYENVSGTGNITMVGTGRAIFPVANTFVGNLTINTTGATDGLQLGTNSAQFNAIPDATNVTLSSTGKLRLSYSNYATEAINGLNGSGTVSNNGGNANYLTVGAGGGDGSFSGTITNGGGTIALIKSGAGTQTLTGTNNFTGGLYITGGTLAFSVDTALGVTPDGTLAFNGVVAAGGTGYTTAPTVTVSGGGGSGGTMTATTTTNVVTRLDTTAAGSGYTSSPTLAFTAAAGSGASGFGVLKGEVVLNGGTLRADTAMTFTRPILVNGTSNGFNTNGNTSTISSTIVGAGGLRKSGAGTLFLTGSNTFTGPMVAGGGILSLPVIPNGGIASIIGQSTSAGANLVLDGGTLQYTGATASTDRAFSTGAAGGTFDIPTGVTLTMGGGSGATYALAGTLTKTGAGTLKIINYTGSTAAAASDIVINQGTMEFGTGYFNASPFGKQSLAITINAGGTLLTSAAHGLGGDNIDSGTSLGQLRIIGGTVTFNGSQYFSGGLVNTTEGRILMSGGTINGTADVRMVPSAVITTLANANSSVISNAGGINLTYANFVTDVAEGLADDDLLVTVPISAANGVVKNGLGNLKLTGASTYAGATTVNTGKLTVANTAGSGTGTGAVTVAAAGTLGGEGAISGAVTVAGTLAPGNTSGAAGTLTTGSLALTGTYACQVSGAQADKVAVNGNLDLTGSTLTISNTGGAGAIYVIASYTGTLTGTFGNVTGVPSGYSLNYNATAKQIELVSGDAGPGGDLDHDGVTNLMEYVLGGNPSASDPGILPKLVKTPGLAHMTFKRTDASELDTTLVLQYSDDLQTWNDIPIGPTSSDFVTVVENGTDPDDIIIDLQLSGPLDQKLFLRLKATQP